MKRLYWSGLLLLPMLASGDEFADYMRQQQQAIGSYQQQQQAEFDQYVKDLEEGFAAFKKIYAEEQKRYSAEVTANWGDYKEGDKKTWVNYDSDDRSRQSVNFETGKVTIEVVTDQNASAETLKKELEARLAKLLSTTEKEAYDADKVAKRVEERLVKDHSNVVEQGRPSAVKPVLAPILPNGAATTQQEEKKLAQALLKEATATTKPKPGNSNEKITQVEFTIPAKLEAKVKPVAARVKAIAAKEELPVPLVLAVIETESYFNPLAKSHVPAYGLMQIVPNSAGKDATAYLFGKAKVLSPSYLFDGNNNIEIGGAYLHILFYRYLKAIENPTSRLFCAIAAYNTGAGNVAKTFGNDRNINKAAATINRMSPQEVYQRLHSNLPYEETRHYLERVSSRMAKYQAMSM
jgi:membrane-bound lytic murein transglycosylase C